MSNRPNKLLRFCDTLRCLWKACSDILSGAFWAEIYAAGSAPRIRSATPQRKLTISLWFIYLWFLYPVPQNASCVSAGMTP